MATKIATEKSMEQKTKTIGGIMEFKIETEKSVIEPINKCVCACAGGVVAGGVIYKLYKNLTSFLSFLCPYIKEEAKHKIIYKKCEWENIGETI